MPFFYSKSLIRRYGLIFLGCLGACAKIRDPLADKQDVHFDQNQYPTYFPSAPAENLVLDRLYLESPSSETACGVIKSTRAPDVGEARFRMASKMDFDMGNSLNGDGYLKCVSRCKDSKKADCYNRCKTKPMEKFELIGRVDIGANPLYQYALLTQKLPTKEEFMALVDQEIKKSPIKIPFLLILKALMATGAVDPYKERNKIIQSRIGESLPGSFDLNQTQVSFKDSFPDVLLRNGSPKVALMLPLPNDTGPQKEQKLIHLQELFADHTKALPLFEDSSSWSAFNRDQQRVVSAVIKSYSSDDPIEQSCATILLHRNLSQYLAIMGRDLPLIQNNIPKVDSVLSGLPEMLNGAHSTEFKVCPTAGAFVQGDRRMRLTPKSLSAFDRHTDEYDLSFPTAPPVGCISADAISQSASNSTTFSQSANAIFKDAQSWVELLESLTTFMGTFNPAASWWNPGVSKVGFPLAKFENLTDIRNSGAILPFDAHALTLGFANIAVAKLLKKYFVFLDQNLKEVGLNGKNKTFVRISSDEREEFSAAQPVVTTSFRTALVAARTVMRVRASFDSWSHWSTSSQAALKQSIAHERDPARAQQMQKDYDDFIASMFGTQENFDQIVDSSDDGVRSELKDLELGMLMLLSHFVTISPDKKHYDCQSEIYTNVHSGVESISENSCGVQDVGQAKSLFNLAAELYQAPVFSDLAQKL